VVILGLLFKYLLFFACKKNQTIKNNKYLKSVHYHLFYCFFNKIIGVITMNKINEKNTNTNTATKAGENYIALTRFVAQSFYANRHVNNVLQDVIASGTASGDL
jgi:hypothetical protein